VYDAGDKPSSSEQEVLLGDIRAQPSEDSALGGSRVEHRSCEGMLCDCDGCPWEDAAPVHRQPLGNGRSVRRTRQTDPEDQTVSNSGRLRKEKEQ
jgi:hypothetical protein